MLKRFPILKPIEIDTGELPFPYKEMAEIAKREEVEVSQVRFKREIYFDDKVLGDWNDICEITIEN